MCGRSSLFVPADVLENRFGARIATDYSPRYNIAPSEPLEVITGKRPDAIDRHTWGLVPRWADDPTGGHVNARSETVAEKPSFREAWRNRPCLVLSSGYYEWQTADGGPKQPYRIHRADDRPFAMAGLWEGWRGDGRDEPLRTVTVLTTEPNGLVEPIHDRMPVVLTPEDERRWLSAGPDDRRELCRPYPDDDLEAYPVSTRVNDPSNDDPAVIDPAESTQADLGRFG